ncbi:hypothetical protein [Nonomuraea typhae]|uniref:hypothetical protein n=1 Tax=Nonomuraea typhae TaxID=2603600 RepID=UPI0012FAE4F6|nr:hypothetical protein [Nonomuraea typhae]
MFKRWPEAAGYGAALWSAGYAVLGLTWLLGWDTYPWGAAAEDPLDPGDDRNFFVTLQPGEAAAPVIVFGLAGMLAGLAVARGFTRFRWPVVAFGALAAPALAVILPDGRALTLLGYLPMIIGGLPFGWPPADWDSVLSWSLIYQFLLLVGGLLWAAATLGHARRARGVCVHCGGEGRWSRERLLRWGRVFAYTGALIPLGYAVTRWAWGLGIPLGIGPEYLAEMHQSGLVWAGVGLATFSGVGAVLTLGLVQRWGEVFPRWIPVLAGRAVPVWLAVAPATLVSVVLFNAGWQILQGHFVTMDLSNPMTWWPLWALALAGATFTYWLRRRPACRHCVRPVLV